MRAEGEQKPSGAVERASHDDARPTEPTAYTLKGINAPTHFNLRAGEEKGGLEGKTPVLPSRVWYCIPPAACRLLCFCEDVKKRLHLLSEELLRLPLCGKMQKA